MLLTTIAWIGSVCFSVCAIPQAYQCYKQKHARGINSLFLWLWFTGEVCLLIYTSIELKDAPLIFNYIFNLLCLSVIIYYWVKGKEQDG